jgi:hypothetical protein
MRALLEGDPLLARRLAGVSIPYTAAEPSVDWLGVFCAGADLLPAAAEQLLASSQSAGSGTEAAAAAAAAAASAAARRALAGAADCVAAAGALAAYQPPRAAAALARARLLAAVDGAGAALPPADPEGGAAAAAPPRVPIEALAATPCGGLPAGLDVRLPGLQSVMRRLEAPGGEYPLTSALLGLAARLLGGHMTDGPVPGLVAFALRDVLGCLGELPFASPAERWRLAAAALRVARLAVAAGAVAEGGAAPKAAAPPSGVLISALAASMLQQMAFAGAPGASAGRGHAGFCIAQARRSAGAHHPRHGLQHAPTPPQATATSPRRCRRRVARSWLSRSSAAAAPAGARARAQPPTTPRSRRRLTRRSSCCSWRRCCSVAWRTSLARCRCSSSG